MMLLFWSAWVCLETTEILVQLVFLEIRDPLDLRVIKDLLVQQAQMEILVRQGLRVIRATLAPQVSKALLVTRVTREFKARRVTLVLLDSRAL
tara:strand:+ start:584 stop:862 length:279 start_codon:yes stop_codon:yes gene_type:complete